MAFMFVSTCAFSTKCGKPPRQSLLLLELSEWQERYVLGWGGHDSDLMVTWWCNVYDNRHDGNVTVTEM